MLHVYIMALHIHEYTVKLNVYSVICSAGERGEGEEGREPPFVSANGRRSSLLH